MLTPRVSTDQGAALVGIGTALPQHRSPQVDVARWFGNVANAQEGCTPRLLSLLEKMAAKSGVEQRYCVLPDYLCQDPSEFEFYPTNWSLDPFPTTANRMKVYRDASVELAVNAAKNALADARVKASSVTHLLITSCTGFFAPGPDIALQRELEISPDVERTIVGFMGCYAGINAMRLADRIVRSDPEAVVLQVSVELCTLHFQRTPDVSTFVANLLFGDGASAAIYTSGPGLARIRTSRSAIAEHSANEMRWDVGDHGFVMHLDAKIPRTIRQNARPFVDALLADIPRSRLAWAIHPGGPRIIEAVARGLDLVEEDVRSSFEVLREFGNLSSATILFVLQRELQRRSAGDRIVTLGFGPGLTIEGVVLDVG